MILIKNLIILKMNNIKYIFLLLFVTSCMYKNQNIQENDIKYIIESIQEDPNNWNEIVLDTNLSDMNTFFKTDSNKKLIVNFFNHIKIDKFNVSNIKTYYIQPNNRKQIDIELSREDNEFNINFIFNYYEDSKKWKLINLKSKSKIIEKFQDL